MAARRDGLFVHYRPAGSEVVRLVLALRHTAEVHLAEVDRVVRDFLGDRDGFEPVTPDELTRRMSTGEAVLLDVRPEQEYAAGHIAGALSIPVADILTRLGELPGDKQYVAYCRGPYCLYADEAVAVLRANGRTAQRLTEGYPEWWLAGRPVSTARSRAPWPSARRWRAATLRASTSPSSWAEPKCSIWREPRRVDHTICTAVAPDEVFTVRP